jgi:hypothetical protein
VVAKLVFALHHAAPKGARCDVAKADVPRHWAKERNACPNENRHARDHQPADASGCEKSLNRDAAVDISVFEAARFEMAYDCRGFPRRLLDNRVLDLGKIKRTAAQHNQRLLAVNCQVSEAQHNLVRPTAHHDQIDAGEEFRKPVWLLLACPQEVEPIVGASEKAIDANSAENCEFYGNLLGWWLVLAMQLSNSFRTGTMKIYRHWLATNLPHHQCDLPAMVGGMVCQMLQQVRQADLCSANRKHFCKELFGCDCTTAVSRTARSSVCVRRREFRW